jgi:hypothetical protein
MLCVLLYLVSLAAAAIEDLFSDCQIRRQNMHHVYQFFHDPMAIIRLNGQPELFLTMTYHPSRFMIQDILFSVQPNVSNHISTVMVIITERQYRGSDHVHQIIFFNDEDMGKFYIRFRIISDKNSGLELQ